MSIISIAEEHRFLRILLLSSIRVRGLHVVTLIIEEEEDGSFHST